MFLFCVGFALYYMSYLPESSMKMRYVNTPPLRQLAFAALRSIAISVSVNMLQR